MGIVSPEVVSVGSPGGVMSTRRRLVAGDAIVNVAFLGLAKIEDAGSTLAVN